MRDSTHSESIERWALFVRENPSWKQKHTAFINAQFSKSQAFVQRMLKTPEGKEKVKQLYNITNVEGYAKLLK